MFLSFEYIIALLLVLTIHEASHAFVAKLFGDQTAERAGRLTLNPFMHIDLLGALMLFFAGFGWGKPVPVDARNFNRPVRDMALTALAGPLSNFLLAILIAIIYSRLSYDIFFLSDFLSATIDISLVLFVFNLLPIPPMDGATFIRIFLSVKVRDRYDNFMKKFGLFFLVVLLADLYLVEKWFGSSILWNLLSDLIFWLKASIFLLV